MWTRAKGEYRKGEWRIARCREGWTLYQGARVVIPAAPLAVCKARAEVAPQPALKPIPAPEANVDAAKGILAALTRNADNHMSLVALRRIVGATRQSFDATISTLRNQGRLTLIGCEGRHGMDASEAEAAIREGAEVLTHAALR